MIKNKERIKKWIAAVSFFDDTGVEPLCPFCHKGQLDIKTFHHAERRSVFLSCPFCGKTVHFN